MGWGGWNDHGTDGPELCPPTFCRTSGQGGHSGRTMDKGSGGDVGYRRRHSFYLLRGCSLARRPFHGWLDTEMQAERCSAQGHSCQGAFPRSPQREPAA